MSGKAPAASDTNSGIPKRQMEDVISGANSGDVPEANQYVVSAQIGDGS